MTEIIVNIHTEKKYDTIVLPGGGIKGFYLLGSINYLLDSELISDVHTYIGTSIGSLISYLTIIGYTPIEIITTIQKNKYLEKIDNFSINSFVNCQGAIDFSQIYNIIEKMTLEKCGQLFTLQKLKETYNKTLVCVTYNMTKNITEYLDYKSYPDLPCLTAIRMSCNIPLIFDRFKYMNCYYIDGGLVNNFAIDEAHKYGNNVLGLNLDNSNSLEYQDKPEEGIISYFVKLVRITTFHNIKEKVKNYRDKMDIIDIYTDSDIKISPINFRANIKVILDMFSCGYTLTRNKFENK
jgi:predicted acylesterase/phospholipase RssA